MLMILAWEGHNIAVIFNTSIHDGSDPCEWGLMCILNDLGKMLVKGFDHALMKEMDLFIESSFDNFDTHRPSIRYELTSNYEIVTIV